MKRRSAKQLVLLAEENYRAMIRSAAGTAMFRSLYARSGRKKKDILRNGELSCAYFVSSLLRQFGYIRELHATVNGTVRDLLKSGHRPRSANRPKLGDVLVWGPSRDSYGHEHIGFSLGGAWAVSTSAARRCVVRHHWTYRGKRKILAVFRPASG